MTAALWRLMGLSFVLSAAGFTKRLLRINPMKTKTRKILQSRANKLQARLRKKGFLSEKDRQTLASIERRLTSERDETERRLAFEYAISKED